MSTDLIAQLTAASQAATAQARATPTPETRAAAAAASADLSAAIVDAGLQPKPRGRACRAGQRQHAEQRARTAENFRRAK